MYIDSIWSVAQAQCMHVHNCMYTGQRQLLSTFFFFGIYFVSLSPLLTLILAVQCRAVRQLQVPQSLLLEYTGQTALLSHVQLIVRVFCMNIMYSVIVTQWKKIRWVQVITKSKH